MKTGIELIAIERREQIEKHGRSVKKDIAENRETELSYFAGLLCHAQCDEAGAINYLPPKWDKDLCIKMIKKPYKERLIIAGALLAAEIDRLQAID
jgi:hypothetical protein